jgi:hypothetical protein
MERAGSQQLCLLHSNLCLSCTVSALRFGELPFAGLLWNGSYGPLAPYPHTKGRDLFIIGFDRSTGWRC